MNVNLTMTGKEFKEVLEKMLISEYNLPIDTCLIGLRYQEDYKQDYVVIGDDSTRIYIQMAKRGGD